MDVNGQGIKSASAFNQCRLHQCLHAAFVTAWHVMCNDGELTIMHKQTGILTLHRTAAYAYHMAAISGTLRRKQCLHTKCHTYKSFSFHNANCATEQGFLNYTVVHNCYAAKPSI